MAKFVYRKLLPIFVGGVLALTAYFTYDGYTKSVTPSAFELAANRLGFNGYKKADKIVTAATKVGRFREAKILISFFQSTLWRRNRV